MHPAIFTASWMFLWKLSVSLPAGASAFEQIILRWVHIVAGIIWIGLLYFQALVGLPGAKSLDPAVRGKAIVALMPRAMWLMRWGAFVTWLAGFRYFMILAQTDAINAGRPLAWLGWIGIWLACWVAAFGIQMALLRPGKGFLGNGIVVGTLVIFVMAAVAWLVVSLLAQPGVGNRTLSISIGGGLGTILLFNVWGIVWRCQKRLIAWTCESVEHGAPMPEEAAALQRLSTITVYISFWLTFPMLFFMAASAHFALFSGQ